MWFKRKPKNRRVGREYVLDVKLRSSQVRAARTRLAAMTLGIVFATVLGVYLLWRGSEWALDRLVYDNKAFALETLDIQTDGIIAVDQLRRWARVKAGENLMRLDLARVKRDLEMVSFIQPPVSIERVLPHTLRIRVTEREPVAQVNVPRPRPAGGIETAVFYLDADGYVIMPLEAGQRSTPASQPGDALPLLSGLNSSELQGGHRVEDPQAQAALQLVVAYERSPMAGLVDLKRIDVSAAEVLLVTTGQGSEVTFGLSSLDQQLRRWREVFDMGQKMGKAILSLDLAITNNIPARWLEASAAPASTPRAPKPWKKKHV
jgi:cell division septal protein FtsQ